MSDHRVPTSARLSLPTVRFDPLYGCFSLDTAASLRYKNGSHLNFAAYPAGDVMELRPEFNLTVGSFPFTEQDWAQTPLAVQAYVSTLHDEMSQLHEQVERLQARLNQDSTTSSRPPSSDSPYKKPRRRTGSSPRPRKGGGKPGHPGHRQVLLAPTPVEELLPESCACGSGEFGLVSPYYTHQVIERHRSRGRG